ncbi:hypothetical protein B296_00018603 [Ensete ventricosum]|uniref:Uncharacterized protein n=1 Tax=Ensete ventricosum TaxID=4639 RepID=A0A426Y420_ENSVE|nr:hypothetical protein B296_00018603 [Ensete ventricosum]
MTQATILFVVSLLGCARAIALGDPYLVASLLRCLLDSNRSNDLCDPGGTTDLSFPHSVKPTAVFLPSTSPAHSSIAAASATIGVDFCIALSLHIVDKFVSFLSIDGHSLVSLTVEVLLLSTATSLPSPISSPLFLLCLPANALVSPLQSPLPRAPASFLCLLVVKDIEGTSSSPEPAIAVLDKIQHHIDADLPDIVRPPLLQPQPPQTLTPMPHLPLLRSNVVVPYHNPLLLRQVLEQQHQSPLFLLPSTAAMLLPQPLTTAIGVGAVASASSVFSSLYRSRASAATAIADGSNRSNNCFPCNLLYYCSFLSQ